MPLANNDIHVTAIRRSYAKDSRGETVPGFEIHYSIRQNGDFTVTVPIAGFTVAKAMEAIAAQATQLVELLDTYPGK